METLTYGRDSSRPYMKFMTYFSNKLRQASLEEKRRARRVAVYDFRLEFRRGSLIKRAGHGEGCDLSETGTRFQTKIKLKKGDFFDAALLLHPDFPGPKKVQLGFEVVRVWRPEREREYRVGCQWACRDGKKRRRRGLPPETAETIRQFMWWIDLRT